MLSNSYPFASAELGERSIEPCKPSLRKNHRQVFLVSQENNCEKKE